MEQRRLLIAIMAILLTLPALASGDDRLAAVSENGHKVWVNEQPVATRGQNAAAVSAEGLPRRASVLVYWSHEKNRWIPVPPPTATAMRAARSAAADVREFVAEQPKSSATDAATEASPKERVESPETQELVRGRKITSESIESAIVKAADRHNVDANLVRAIIKQESNFNPRAVSNKGALGLMQLMPGTARDLNVANPFDPQQNVDAGVRHFKGLMAEFGGDVELSLAAYNAGAAAVQRNKGVPPYAETRNYVKRITQAYRGGAMTHGGPANAPIVLGHDAQGHKIYTNVD